MHNNGGFLQVLDLIEENEVMLRCYKVIEIKKYIPLGELLDGWTCWEALSSAQTQIDSEIRVTYNKWQKTL